MGATTNISWCDATFNPFIGCTKISPGCDNCYAETLMDKRYGRVTWGPHGERVRTSVAYWRQPLTWAKRARLALETWERQPIVGRSRTPPARPRVFCASLADVFDNHVPAEWLADLFALIAQTPELDWLLLTKRPENIRKMLPGSCVEQLVGRDLPWPWPNVWLGFTAEDQAHFDRRWPIVREIPAVVRFCSYEPAIGPLRLPPLLRLDGSRIDAEGLHWLICGGESGAGHRDMPPQWERDIRIDCEQFGISYFFKQMAGKAPIPKDFPLVRQFPRAA